MGAAIAALAKLFASLPTTQEDVLAFLRSPDTPETFAFTRLPHVRFVIDRLGEDVVWLLENLEELTIYWSARMKEGVTLPPTVLEKLSHNFSHALRIMSEG
eukprot:JP436865.1.p2 GENE.JP436865.1~~JP436865.1.p2  ORF type:complete len:101 (+),score=5.41 JP436865.1:1-303(+)